MSDGTEVVLVALRAVLAAQIWRSLMEKQERGLADLKRLITDLLSGVSRIEAIRQELLLAQHLPEVQEVIAALDEVLARYRALEATVLGMGGIKENDEYNGAVNGAA